jgi:hypothetical protein
MLRHFSARRPRTSKIDWLTVALMFVSLFGFAGALLVGMYAVSQ